jgi:hypothetical protein
MEVQDCIIEAVEEVHRSFQDTQERWRFCPRRILPHARLQTAQQYVI